MKPASEQLLAALKGSFKRTLIVDAFYGPRRTIPNLGTDGWNLDWDSEAEVSAAGSITIVHTDPEGKSLSPAKLTDPLAPFGQEVNVLCEIRADQFAETIQLGHYRISAVPSTSDTYFTFNGDTKVAASRVELTLEDRMMRIRRDGFATEQNPTSLTSCYAEIQRLTGMQLIRTLPDKPVPADTVYGTQSGARLKAVQALADVIGGVAYVTPDGALSIRSHDRGRVVRKLVLGTEGTILDVPSSLESEDVINHVVGNFETGQGDPIFAEAQLTDGPLAVDGPYGRYTAEIGAKDNPFVRNQRDADLAVRAALQQMSSRRTYRVSVTCVFDPLIDDGDVVSVQRRDGGTTTGRVIKHTLPSSGPMSLELEVIRDIT